MRVSIFSLAIGFVYSSSLIAAAPLWRHRDSKQQPPAAGNASTPLISYINADGAVIDAQGRERYFHGVNVVYKGSPYHPVVDHFDPKLSFSSDDAKVLQQLNINVVRLGVEWAGVEPTKGQYNQSYLDTLLSIVRTCNEYGIYVLLDMHQDVYSEQFCGEGFPQWTVYPPTPPSIVGFPVPVQRVPFTIDGNVPNSTQCDSLSWALGQMTWAAAKSYQDLYDNVNGNLDAFAAFWKTVASQFKDEPNILGYELMNEPWGGNQFLDPTLLTPGVADIKNLQKAWDQLATSIRQVDTSTLIFFEGLTLDNGIVGFSHVPGGDQYKNKSVLSYHWYNGGVNVIAVDPTIEANILSAKRLGSGAMLTEFDIAWANGNLTNALATMETADAHLQSWIGWEYKSYVRKTGWGESLWDEEQGVIHDDMARLYARTYASAVQGHVNSIYFNWTTGGYNLSFAAEVVKASGPTEIRVAPKWWYPQGMSVVAEATSSNSSIAWSLSSDNTTVFINLPSTVTQGEIISVHVGPISP